MPCSLDFSYDNISAIDIFLERFQTRLFVGRLERFNGEFQFTYADAYLKEKNVISLGPEFPLTRKDFHSSTLFKSLQDRIPDPDNPAYENYCKEFNISPLTKDPLILLTTIGRRGPSSFIFEPVYADSFTFDDFNKFRKSLGLSLHDTALLFDVSLSILQKIKAGNSSGKEVLKRLQLYCLFKEALLFQVKCNGKFLHKNKMESIMRLLNIIT